MSMFTRKLNPYLSNRINAYWYRARYIEFEPDKKRKRKKPNVIVKSYQTSILYDFFVQSLKIRMCGMKILDDFRN